MRTCCGRILWIDSLGGLFVGVFVLAICGPLSKWENLPFSVVLALGIANLLYGSYSMYVTIRNPRSMNSVKILAIANMLWLVVCCALVSTWWNEISMIGLAHLLGEGVYVAGLGYTEWRYRRCLAPPSPTR